jgi:colanic acid/amylovoran biosynthesis glycosyltransferase
MKDMLDEVVLMGKKNRQQVKASLNEHDIFVLPAVAVDNERRETQGLATLEAQSCGLPVVVFDSGGVKYTVMDGVTGFVVPEYDVKSFVLKIERLITDNELRNNMGRKAIQFVRNEFSLMHLREVWCKVYSEKINHEG